MATLPSSTQGSARGPRALNKNPSYEHVDNTTREPVAPVINHGEEAALITLTTANDAALGNFVITANGHPTKGAHASSELKLVVVTARNATAQKQLSGR